MDMVQFKLPHHNLGTMNEWSLEQMEEIPMILIEDLVDDRKNFIMPTFFSDIIVYT